MRVNAVNWSPHLIESCHQVLHSVASLSTLGRHGGHRQRGLEVRVALALTLGTAQVSSKETEVVQRKDLQKETDKCEFIINSAHLNSHFSQTCVCVLSPAGKAAALAR